MHYLWVNFYVSSPVEIINNIMSIVQEGLNVIKLIKIRNTCKGQITTIEQWLNGPDYNELYLEAKMWLLESHFQSFNQAQDQVEMVKDTEVEERYLVDAMVCELKAKMKRLKVRQSKNSDVDMTIGTSESTDPSKVRVEVHAPIEVSMPTLLPYDGHNDLEFMNFLTSSKALFDHSQSSDLTKQKYGVLQGTTKDKTLQAATIMFH